MQQAATHSSKHQQRGNTHRGRFFQPALVSIFLIAIILFSATVRAQVSPYPEEVSAEDAVNGPFQINYDYTQEENGDGSDPVGGSRNWMRFNPPHFEYMGWYDPVTYELRTVIPSSTLQVFDLLPTDEGHMEWPGLRALKTKRAGTSNYYFSYRQQTGQYNNVPSSYTTGVSLHWVDGGGFSYFYRMIRQGDIFADAAADLVVWGVGPMTIDNPEFTDETEVFTLQVCNTTCSILVRPLNLAVRDIYAGSIQLTWQDYTHNEDGFRVEYSPDGSDWTTLGTAMANAVSYVHSGPDVGSTFFYYRVSAYRGESETSDWSYVASATTPSTNPGIAPDSPPATDTGVSDSDNIPTDPAFGIHQNVYTGNFESSESGNAPALAISADTAALTDHFVTTWQTDNPGTSNETSITVPMIGGPYDVDWDNDGTFDELGVTGPVTHDYQETGTKTISIRGIYDSIAFSNGGDKEKILSLDQWGTNPWTSMNAAFYGCENLVLTARDIPDFSVVTNMRFMFYEAITAKPDVSNWDTSSVTSMHSMFGSAASANPDVSNWDTSSVTNMSSMFFNATSAKPDVSNWDTSSVTGMDGMFGSAASANPDVSNWDTSSVTSMLRMFASAVSANPDVSNWDTSSVTNMSSMFFNATSANPDVSNWDTSSITSMASMFASAASAIPDVSNWDTSSVTNMGWMFFDAASANPDVSDWDTSSVTSMLRMFGSTASANPDVSNWDTSSVTNMSSMFGSATSANPDVSNWDTSSVTSMDGMFQSAAVANPDVGNWDTSSVTATSNMFNYATSFNRDLGSWDVTSISEASHMFNGVTLSTTNYDSLLVGWDAQSLQSGVTFDGGNSKHCSDAAVAARANMIESDAWIITDGGYECTPSFIMNAGLNDAWFNPVTDGQGFFITVFPDIQKVALSWFTYDTVRPDGDVMANLGEPGHRWLNALGSYSGNTAQMDISITSGGIFDTATGLTRVDDGTIVLTFTDCNTGVVEYDIPSINQQGSVPIQRVVGDNIALCESISEPAMDQQVSSRQTSDDTYKLLSDEPVGTVDASPLVNMNAGLNDAWFNPVTDGQGFFITVFPDIQKVALSWFTYDTVRPDGDIMANLGEPGHRWLNALGSYSGNQAQMDISITSGGIFDTATGLTRVDDGTIVLTFTDCNTGTVEYDILSINQQGSVPIQRVVGDNIALCESISE